MITVGLGKVVAGSMISIIYDLAEYRIIRAQSQYDRVFFYE